MNYRMISRVMGLILLAMAALMLLPLIAGLCFHERVVNFIITIAVTAALGGLAPHALIVCDLLHGRALFLFRQRAGGRVERRQTGKDALGEHVAEIPLVRHAERPAHVLHPPVDLQTGNDP